MAEAKVKVYTPVGGYVGYFLAPTIQQYPEGEYEITGRFFDENGLLAGKLEFNPEALPYTADLSELSLPHARLGRGYIQRGRQPVTMTGVGLAG